MSQGRLHGSRASAPEPCRCVSLGNVHPPDLRSIHPALTHARPTGQGEIGIVVGQQMGEQILVAFQRELLPPMM
jgi:hypothetical protein